MMRSEKYPCKEGQIFKLKDGRAAKIYMVHRPGNGFGVHYTIVGKEYPEWPNNKEPYMRWSKFKKLILE